MSGTSADGIDCALVEQAANGDLRLVHSYSHPLGAGLRDAIGILSHSGDAEIEQLGILDRQLGAQFAAGALALLDKAGVTVDRITAIGSHGQTIRHRPPSRGHASSKSFSLQVGDPNTIAELTGITTVADFRRRDIAAGGEGAPLAPAFHAATFGAAGKARAIVNLGGIANLSCLDGKTLLRGFDTGPANTLLDYWCHEQCGEPFDREGRWAAGGSVIEDLLASLLNHPFLAQSPPKSTGKEDFNPQWLNAVLASFAQLAPADVQATLAQFTTETVARAIDNHHADAREVYLCGGGANNPDLAARLGQRLPGCLIDTTSSLGIDPDWVEAAAFAWLAGRTLAGLAGNAPQVTGARSGRVLGAIYPGQ